MSIQILKTIKFQKNQETLQNSYCVEKKKNKKKEPILEKIEELSKNL